MTEPSTFYIAQVNRALENGQVGLAAELAEDFAREDDPPTTLTVSPSDPTRPVRRLMLLLDGWTLTTFSPLHPRRAAADEAQDDHRAA